LPSDNIRARIDEWSAEFAASVAANRRGFSRARRGGGAIDLAAWAIDNARVAMLDAIDARANRGQSPRAESP
jgi:hypothetical protein